MLRNQKTRVRDEIRHDTTATTPWWRKFGRSIELQAEDALEKSRYGGVWCSGGGGGMT